MARPIALNVRYRPLATTMQAGIVADANTCTRGVEIVKAWRERGQGIGVLLGLAVLALHSRFGGSLSRLGRYGRALIIIV
jgi:hypothetical protein